MVFENDEQALTYANEMTDGAETVKVERFSTNSGDWFVRYAGEWIYDAEANREVTNFLYNPALAINSYSSVKAIAEELRGLAVEFNVPIWSATQVNRTGFSSSDMPVSGSMMPKQTVK